MGGTAGRRARIARRLRMRRARIVGLSTMCAFALLCTGLVAPTFGEDAEPPVVEDPGPAPALDVGFHPTAPASVLDTRPGGTLGRIAAGGTVSATVGGVGEIPSTGVGAVVLSIVAVSPTRSGELKASSSDAPPVRGGPGGVHGPSRWLGNRRRTARPGRRRVLRQRVVGNDACRRHGDRMVLRRWRVPSRRRRLPHRPLPAHRFSECSSVGGRPPSSRSPGSTGYRRRGSRPSRCKLRWTVPHAGHVDGVDNRYASTRHYERFVQAAPTRVELGVRCSQRRGAHLDLQQHRRGDQVPDRGCRMVLG